MTRVSNKSSSLFDPKNCFVLNTVGIENPNCNHHYYGVDHVNHGVDQPVYLAAVYLKTQRLVVLFAITTNITPCQQT